MMNVDQERERLRAPAYHEAGHAVAAHVFGRRLRSVSIVATNGRLGHCRLASSELETLPASAPNGPETEPAVGSQLHTLGVIALSGNAAVRLAGMCIESESDVATAGRLVDRLLGTEHRELRSADAALLLARWTREAETLLRTHWHSVERLVEALLWVRSLSGPRVHDLVESSTDRNGG